MGFAPLHIFTGVTGDTLRLLTSIFLTHDFQHLASATGMILIVVGWTERTRGSTNTVFISGLSHLIAMFIFAIGISVLHAMRLSSSSSLLYAFHDVGPSAAYYGCLGSIAISSAAPYRRPIIAGAVGILSVRILLSMVEMPDSKATLSADVVHFVAMGVGMAASLLMPAFDHR